MVMEGATDAPPSARRIAMPNGVGSVCERCRRGGSLRWVTIPIVLERKNLTDTHRVNEPPRQTAANGAAANDNVAFLSVAANSRLAASKSARPAKRIR